MWRVFSKRTEPCEFYLSNRWPARLASLFKIAPSSMQTNSSHPERISRLSVSTILPQTTAVRFRSIPICQFAAFLSSAFAIRSVKLPGRWPLPTAHRPFLQSEPKGSWPLWQCRFQSDLKMRNFTAARAPPARPKDQFLAILSHELRTPLTPIFAILATIERYPELPEQIRSDLLVINRNLQLEARLIDDLLDLTRINKGKISLLLRNYRRPQTDSIGEPTLPGSN